MAQVLTEDIRSVLLETVVVRAPRSQTDGALFVSTVIDEAQRRLNARNNPELEQAVLTEFYDLFRSGILSWGHNLANPNPPHFHLTDRGKTAILNRVRDPHNPAGYFAHLGAIAKLDDVSASYLSEAVSCFVAGLNKAAAVMVGYSAERLVIELRDVIVAKLATLGQAVPPAMNDWRARAMSNAVFEFLDSRKAGFERDLREAFEAYWPSLTHVFRVARNDAGHPVSVDPVTEAAIHASLLLFPELARLQNRLISWVSVVLK